MKKQLVIFLMFFWGISSCPPVYSQDSFWRGITKKVSFYLYRHKVHKFHKRLYSRGGMETASKISEYMVRIDSLDKPNMLFTSRPVAFLFYNGLLHEEVLDEDACIVFFHAANQAYSAGCLTQKDIKILEWFVRKSRLPLEVLLQSKVDLYPLPKLVKQNKESMVRLDSLTCELKEKESMAARLKSLPQEEGTKDSLITLIFQIREMEKEIEPLKFNGIRSEKRKMLLFKINNYVALCSRRQD